MYISVRICTFGQHTEYLVLF